MVPQLALNKKTTLPRLLLDNPERVEGACGTSGNWTCNDCLLGGGCLCDLLVSTRHYLLCPQRDRSQ